MAVKLLWATESAEQLIAYAARVSSPNQENPEIDRLLNYCIKHKHWSIFEMANMCVEIQTSRAVGRQILRHRSFSFQEFSQRYSEIGDADKLFVAARRQDLKNRQNSFDDLHQDTVNWFNDAQRELWDKTSELYAKALDRGIAKECARMLLPEATRSKMYMNGSIRSWIHYLELRCDGATQLEHREVANDIKEIFIEQFPVISKALGWV